MDTRDLVSVIVPVYKVEPYLDRCVESLCRQSYPALEIILVDDGSPDRCGALCDAWAEKDARIRVLHKENGGLSDARNRGVELAKGAYISFVDSDDYVSPDYVAYLMALLREQDADIACGGYRMVSAGGETFDGQPDERVLRLEREDACLALLGQEHYMPLVTAWAKLFPAQLVRDNPFPKGRLHEDEATTYKYYDGCRAVALGTREIYAYYQNPQSITHTKTRKNREATLLAAEEQWAWFDGRGEERLRRAAADRLLNDAVYLAAKGDETYRAFLRSGEAARYLEKGLRIKTRVRYAGYRLFGADLTEAYHKILKK